MIAQCKFISCNKGSTLMEILIMGRYEDMCVGVRDMGEISATSSQILCKAKTVLKSYV